MWTVEIEVLDIAKKSISLTATRTDGDDIRSYTVNQGLIETSQQKVAIMQNIWDQYQADLVKEAQAQAVVDNLESQAQTWLNEKEV